VAAAWAANTSFPASPGSGPRLTARHRRRPEQGRHQPRVTVHWASRTANLFPMQRSPSTRTKPARVHRIVAVQIAQLDQSICRVPASLTGHPATSLPLLGETHTSCQREHAQGSAHPRSGSGHNPMERSASQGRSSRTALIGSVERHSTSTVTQTQAAYGTKVLQPYRRGRADP
jgi:hypothetical protein